MGLACFFATARALRLEGAGRFFLAGTTDTGNTTTCSAAARQGDGTKGINLLFKGMGLEAGRSPAMGE
jgi:hypothetical protein